MRKIRLIVFASMLHDAESVINSRAALFAGLRQMGDLEVVKPEELESVADHNAFGETVGTRRVDNGAVTICFIATGGTEEIFQKYFDKVPRPVIILSDGLHNSFAAAFEICTFLDRRVIRNVLINAPLEPDSAFFDEFGRKVFGWGEGKGEAGALSAGAPSVGVVSAGAPGQIGEGLQVEGAQKGGRETAGSIDTGYSGEGFRGARIGLVGGESAWLIASHIDREAVEARYGCEFIDVPIRELEADYFEIRKIGTARLMRGFHEMSALLAGGRTEDDLCDAWNMYLALTRVCDSYKLTALTIKCFDLLGPCRTTSCLALSLLNDAGIVAGCEGDIPTLWTMMYVKQEAGKDAKQVEGEDAKPEAGEDAKPVGKGAEKETGGARQMGKGAKQVEGDAGDAADVVRGLSFMANPSSSNAHDCTVDFAHCTVPIAMTEAFTLPSHFESSIGIGVAGVMPLGRYRLTKIGGAKLDKMFCAEGEVIENTHVVERCRTQVRFKFDSREDFERFMGNRMGNHVVMARV